MTDTATVLLVHGAWCGEWAYWKLTPCLDARGVPWVGTDLPSCRATDASIDIRDDAAYVRELISGVDGPVIVVGKSYGGAVIGGAAVDLPNVAHLVYVAAMMPAAGQSFMEAIGAARTPEFARGIKFLDDGRTEMDPEIGAQTAFTHASEEDRDVWRRNRRPMSIGRDPSVAFDRVAWETIPSTYVICADDHAIDPSAQRAWAQQATHQVEKPFDHSPGVSHPDEVADLLADIARSREKVA